MEGEIGQKKGKLGHITRRETGKDKPKQARSKGEKTRR